MWDIHDAQAEWGRLEIKRNGLEHRAERLAEITIPSVCPPDEYNTGQDSLTNGFTSMGAQCLTHLTNKLMLAMFSASRPFFRLAISEKDAKEMAEALQVSQDVLTDILSQGERDALLQLEMSGSRESLYEGITHLACVGNVLMDLRSKTGVEFIPIKEYACKRARNGEPLKIIIRQCLTFAELEEEVQDILRKEFGHCLPHNTHKVYTYCHRYKGKMRIDMQVDHIPLPYERFGSTTSIEDCPLRPLAWRLPLGQDYGVGRVEEYYNDLASHETVAEALNDGAVLASQFRWLQNPSGITRPEDFQNAANGAVIPGVTNDLALVFANIGNQLNTVLAISQQYLQRLGAGFLISSAVTRQAERVTAEEIRLQAQELESSLGGVYSRLARDIQGPIARWLMRKADMNINGTKIRPVIITGIDALSRNADLERLQQFIAQVTNLGEIPPQTLMKLQESSIIADIAAGLGVNKQRYVASDDEIQQRLTQMQQAQAQQGAAPV